MCVCVCVRVCVCVCISRRVHEEMYISVWMCNASVGVCVCGWVIGWEGGGAVIVRLSSDNLHIFIWERERKREGREIGE